ncbi:MAG: thioesterase family protein [Sandaracinaceae bacterium]|nr:thioesterase family protein [Sandaracinaceae bacterium]
MIDDLALASAISRLGPDRFLFDVPAHWEQGRGAYGGIVVAAMARAALQCEPEIDRAIRAVSSEILSPVLQGPAEVVVEELRRGNGVSAFDVRIRQREADALVVRAHATITLGRNRVADRTIHVPPPAMPSFESTPRAPIAPPFGPVFAQHLDFRPVGPAPFSGAKEAHVEGWVHAPKCSSWGAPEVLALVDSYWPAALVLEPAPRPMVTLAFTAHVFDVPAQGPLYFRSTASSARDGFVSELRELFGPDGQLVVSNPQLIAIVK